MTNIELLRKKLEKDGFKIVKEVKGEIVPELSLQILPGKAVSTKDSRRKTLRSFTPFFIKDCDSAKLSSASLTAIEELRQEIRVCEGFKECNSEIPLVDKIAILHINGEPFLVEVEIEPYTEERFRKLGLIEKAENLVNLAKEKFPNHGDFKMGNLGYDSRDNKLKFYDVFPKLSI